MTQTAPDTLRQLDERQGFEALRGFLTAYWERGGRRSDDLAGLIARLEHAADDQTRDPAPWLDWREAVKAACAARPEGAQAFAPSAASPKPTMEARQLGFFSDWYVVVVWPSGKKQRVDGFNSKAHALGWIEHESPEWIANQKP
jgi:hypothetical protein